jgi:hypothetical protein
MKLAACILVVVAVAASASAQSSPVSQRGFL